MSDESSSSTLKPQRRVGRIVLLVVIAIVVGAVLYVEGRQSTGPAEGATLNQPASPTTVSGSVLMPHHGLRIGTFNIDGGQGADGQVDLTRTASCLQRLDFIGLNEVHGFASGDPPNQAVALGDLLHLPYLYVPAERRWGHDSFGNAIFSDLPVTHWQRVVLPSKPFHAYRNYLLTNAMWHGTTIHFLTTHVDWKSGGDEQLGVVSDVFLHLPTPAVLMGDLNHPPSSPQIRALLATAGVEESIHEIYRVEDKPRVDWIFLRGLRTLDGGTVDLGASDHPAFWAEVAMPAGPATSRSARRKSAG